MCKPIEGNFVRLKKTIVDVKARHGSSNGLGGTKRHVLKAGSEGIAKGPDPSKPDHFLIMFEHEGTATLVASICHTEMKGVEQHL